MISFYKSLLDEKRGFVEKQIKRYTLGLQILDQTKSQVLGLQEDLKIPVGIIHCSQGGTPIEPWIAPKGALFQKIIGPIVPYTLRGSVWYQGEGNVAKVNKQDYSQFMQQLVGSWRKI